MEQDPAKENADVIKKTSDADQLFKRYASKCYTSALRKYAEETSETSYNYLLAELAESALSSEILGRPGSNISLIKI